jgi:ABC-type multidrug transport system ATPase subunit
MATRAVQGIDFDVQPGEIFAMRPNGAGKRQWKS